MKQFLGKIFREWEKTIFWCGVAVFSLVLLLWLSGFGEDDDQSVSRQGAPPQRSLLNETALAFLQEIAPEDVKVKNPFAFVVERKKPRRPWERQPEKKPKPDQGKGGEAATTMPKPITSKPVTPNVVKLPIPTVAVPVVKPPPPKPVKPKPKKPLASRIVEYRGTMTTATGERVALVKTSNPLSKETFIKFMRENDSVQGIKIGAFGEESLKLVDPKGKSSEVMFGEKKTITIE